MTKATCICVGGVGRVGGSTELQPALCFGDRELVALRPGFLKK
jgi:hypothetical protein